MAINYKSYEFRLYNGISQTLDLFKRVGDGIDTHKEQERLRSLQNRLESRRFRVVVVGEFNRGKTSFVNALLGKEILPSDLMPTTAALNRITYGDAPDAYVVMKNGEKRRVKISDLSNYITKLSSSAAETASRVQEAVIEYPSLFCRNGVDLIDTPGMNDENAMDSITLSQLENIDLAIVAIDAQMPFSLTERTFMTQLLESPQVCQIIIVMTKMDTIRERDRARVVDYTIGRIRESMGNYLRDSAASQRTLEKYHAIFDEPIVFPVSSLDALEALTKNDAKLFSSSGFLRLNDELPEIILASQNNNIVLGTARELNDILNRLRQNLETRSARRRNCAEELDKLKRDLESACSPNTLQTLCTMPDSLFPNPEELLPSLRMAFIQALNGVRELSGTELERVLLPVIREQFRFVGTTLHEQEQSLLSEYQRNFLEPAKRRLWETLRSLVEPYPELCEALDKQWEPLSACLSMERGISGEQFYWVSSPLPAEMMARGEWNIMPYINDVISASLKNYRFRRGQKMRNQFAEHGQEVENRRVAFLDAMRQAVEEYRTFLREDRDSAQMLGRTQELQADCANVREQFLNELELARNLNRPY